MQEKKLKKCISYIYYYKTKNIKETKYYTMKINNKGPKV